MKTSVMELHDMLSVFSVDEVEKRIGEVPGVKSVTVDFAAGNATVRFDETLVKIADIKSAVRQRGFQQDAPVDGSPSEVSISPTPVSELPPVASTDASSSTPPVPASEIRPEPDNTASPAAPEPAPADPSAESADTEDTGNNVSKTPGTSEKS